MPIIQMFPFSSFTICTDKLFTMSIQTMMARQNITGFILQ